MTNMSGGILPPKMETADGKTRRLGVELEFSGLDIESIASTLADELGGSVQPVSRYECKVTDTEFGPFGIELDFHFLKTLGREDSGDVSEFDINRLSEEVLAEIAKRIVPFEIVTPPLPMNRIDMLDPVVARLRAEGARGTRHSPAYAFGLHLNPEAPSLDEVTLGAYIKSFLCLYEWLLRVNDVDWTRRVTPYINPFPKDYVRRVVDRDYRPTMNELIDDYLEWNADRNRALDMLPLFAHLDEDRVRSVIDDPRIKARPAFHYRLPNCDIDVDGWSIKTPWKLWLQVEYLASDRSRLERICRAYVEYLDNPVGALFENWSKSCERWLIEKTDR